MSSASAPTWKQCAVAKRLDGEGSIRTRASDGLLEWRYYYIDTETDERKRGSVYAKDTETLKARIADVRQRLNADQPPVDSKLTVATWCDQWIVKSLRVSQRATSTKENYERLLVTHVRPGDFGSIQLRKLRPTDVEKFMDSLARKGLSASTRRSVFNVLNLMLEGARKNKLIGENPIRRGELHRPQTERVEQRFLSVEEVEELISNVHGDHYVNVLRLIAATGLRKGEALALEWWHVDIKNRVLRVRQTLSRLNGGLTSGKPKSRNSNRDVDLAPEVVALLQRQKKLQQEQRRAAGDQWGGDAHAYVFTSAMGAPLEPRNLLRAVESAVKRTGIDPTGIGVHTFRHSAASDMLLANVPMHLVSRILGHDDIQTTVNTYGHITQESKRAALEGLSKRLSLQP